MGRVYQVGGGGGVGVGGGGDPVSTKDRCSDGVARYDLVNTEMSEPDIPAKFLIDPISLQTLN